MATPWSCNWRIRTEQNCTVDEYAITHVQSFHQQRQSALADIDDVIISCVVPPC